MRTSDFSRRPRVLVITWCSLILRSRRAHGKGTWSRLSTFSPGILADDEFATLQLDAQKPATDGGVVTFNPPTALPRAALVWASDGSGLGYVYVSFGNARDIQPWHGWIFELDLEAWRSQGTDKAISAVLLTTPEGDCGEGGLSRGSTMVCGGGVWNPAGPQVINTPTGYELLVATGNGELDLNRQDYAQSVLRLTKGLNFDPACDAALVPISTRCPHPNSAWPPVRTSLFPVCFRTIPTPGHRKMRGQDLLAVLCAERLGFGGERPEQFVSLLGWR